MKKSGLSRSKYALFAIILLGIVVLLVYTINYSPVLKTRSMRIRLPYYREGDYRKVANASHPVRVYKEYLTFPGKYTLKISCGSCAYVTGSGHLRGSNLGNEIDSMDCVIRSNDAPTKDFEKDVGKKTTIRTADRNSLSQITKHVRKKDGFDEKIYNETIIVLYGYPNERALREKSTMQALKEMPFVPIYMISNERFQLMLYVFDNRIEKNEHKIWFTNGFVTLLFMQDICEEIHVYGIINSTHCSRVKSGEVESEFYHYYPLQGRKLKECDWMKMFDDGKKNVHHYTNEKKLFEQLRQEWGNLHFHAPEWP